MDRTQEPFRCGWFISFQQPLTELGPVVKQWHLGLVPNEQEGEIGVTEVSNLQPHAFS